MKDPGCKGSSSGHPNAESVKKTSGRCPGYIDWNFYKPSQ